MVAAVCKSTTRPEPTLHTVWLATESTMERIGGILAEMVQGILREESTRLDQSHVKPITFTPALEQSIRQGGVNPGHTRKARTRIQLGTNPDLPSIHQAVQKLLWTYEPRVKG